MIDSGERSGKERDSKIESNSAYSWRIPAWFPELPAPIVDKLKIYLDELLFFNAKMSLISPRTEANADFVHLADGLMGCRAFSESVKTSEIFDLGSGNGIPGLVFALLNPSKNVRLVEADGRKIQYLKHCISKMSLKNCSTVHARVEDLQEGSMKAAMTRGLASVSKCLLMSRRSAAPGCEFYHFKGQSWSKEIAEIPSQILAAWDLRHVIDYNLPESGPSMSIILTTKK